MPPQYPKYPVGPFPSAAFLNLLRPPQPKSIQLNAKPMVIACPPFVTLHGTTTDALQNVFIKPCETHLKPRACLPSISLRNGFDLILSLRALTVPANNEQWNCEGLRKGLRKGLRQRQQSLAMRKVWCGFPAKNGKLILSSIHSMRKPGISLWALICSTLSILLEPELELHHCFQPFPSFRPYIKPTLCILYSLRTTIFQGRSFQFFIDSLRLGH